MSAAVPGLRPARRDEPNASLDDPTQLGAAELAARMRSGRLSAVAVLEAHIARIEAVDPALNAVVVRRFERARAEALAADAARAVGRPLGALHGVPVTLKDPFLLAGTPSTLGLAWRRDHLEGRDGPLVAALRAAGAIVLGKTNLSQAMAFTEADNPVYGRTIHPLDLERSPGGSSGGEAAIIAAGGSPLGLGTDLGGSIRFPAHWTGIAGLKPTSGRLTLADAPEDVLRPPLEGLFAQPGPMARQVEDLHLAMLVLSRAAAGPAADGSDAPPYPCCLPDARGLRIAVQLDEGLFRSAPAVRRALAEACADLVRAGASLVEFRPPPLREAPRLLLRAMPADGGAWVRAALRDAVPDRRVAGLLRAAAMPGPSRRLLAAALRAGGQRHLSATLASGDPTPGGASRSLLDDIAAYRAAYTDAMDAGGVDVVLSPPHALAALPHGASGHLTIANAGAYGALYNVLGLPAGVVPVTAVCSGEESERPPGPDLVERAARATERGSAGLPVGVQVAGRAWREDTVLAVMAAIERAVLGRAGA